MICFFPGFILPKITNNQKDRFANQEPITSDITDTFKSSNPSSDSSYQEGKPQFGSNDPTAIGGEQTSGKKYDYLKKKLKYDPVKSIESAKKGKS